VWLIHNFERYEFKCEFELGPTYPISPPEFVIAELDGKTAKMYRGGKICMTDHFYPLWARTYPLLDLFRPLSIFWPGNVPKFGIAHLLCLGVSPWLQVEIPRMADAGKIKPISGQ